MASVQKVQSYLSYWFQLGKPVVCGKSQGECLPEPIFHGSQYSMAFEQCWQKIIQSPADFYLRGTDESIADLLSDEWDIVSCARCPMPMPMPVRGIRDSPCPCADLPSWPNDEIPQPRPPVCTANYLNKMRRRLDDRLGQEQEHLHMAYTSGFALAGSSDRTVIGDR